MTDKINTLKQIRQIIKTLSQPDVMLTRKRKGVPFSIFVIEHGGRGSPECEISTSVYEALKALNGLGEDSVKKVNLKIYPFVLDAIEQGKMAALQKSARNPYMDPVRHYFWENARQGLHD